MTCWIKLQRFAEDAAAGAGGSTGETPAADAQTADTAVQGESTPAAAQEDQRLSFAQLLEDQEYRKEYDRRLEREVKRRFRGQQKLLEPLLMSTAQQYGLDTTNPSSIDLKALMDAYNGDRTRLEQEAAENGYATDDWMTVKESRRIIEERREEEEDRKRETFFREMRDEGQALERMTQGFSYDKAMENEEFGRLAVSLKANGVSNPVQAAWRALHYEDMVREQVAQAEERTRQQISATLQSGAARPRENGNGQAAAQVKIDPRNLNEAQRKEIRERIRNGERIHFG